MFKILWSPCTKSGGGGGVAQDPSRQVNFILWWLIFVEYQHVFFFLNCLAPRILGWAWIFGYFVNPVHKCTWYNILKAHKIRIHQYKGFQSLIQIFWLGTESFYASPVFVIVCSLEFGFVYPRLQAKWNTEEYYYGPWMICTRPSNDSPPSSEISQIRCNNCVFILRNGFTLHVSGDNLTHHQEYIYCIWPQVSRLT